MISAASISGRETDAALIIITGICVALLSIITFFMLYFVFRYSRDKNPEPLDMEGSPVLEISLLAGSVALVLFMFYIGLGGYKSLRGDAPAGALTVDVTARQWLWSFEYPNKKASNALYLPAGRPVAVRLRSEDVIHSFYIPAFRVKQDAVPGAVNRIWFTPDRQGSFDLFCAEYCGAGHSLMITKAEVMGAEDFDRWFEGKEGAAQAKAPAPQKKAPLAEKGEGLYRSKGCSACHTSDGSKLIGPSFKGIFGTKVRVTTNGRTREVTADEAYIRRSDLEPGADIVEGYAPVMPKIALTEEEIGAIIEYIKSLR